MRRLLDSLANLSVAAPQHEVMAVAFRPTAYSIELLIAGKPSSANLHYQSYPTFMASLEELSVDYRRYNQLSDESRSPP